MAPSPVIVFAGLALLLAISKPAAADLDIYFYDDGASGMAIKVEGSFDVTQHSGIGSGGVFCNPSSAFTTNILCWGASSFDATGFSMDRGVSDIVGSAVSYVDNIGSFPLPKILFYYSDFYVENSYTDNSHISSIGHTVGTDVATIFGSKVGDVETYTITSGAMETITFHLGIAPEPTATGTVIADPHFFVGDTHVYDWKAVGVYNHLEFADHSLELTVEDYTGCDGKNTGEYIRAMRVPPTGSALIAACDGIYDAHNSTLLAKRQMKVETPCFAADVNLVNGYLNIYNVETSCPLTGGVFKTISDHAADNTGGWWEVVNGVFTHKHSRMPSVVPLEKEPMVIKIDF